MPKTIKKKQVEDKKPLGRKPKYDPQTHPTQAGELALSGKTDKEIAACLGISESTLNVWKQKFPDFSESLNKNKDIVDSGVVKSLLQRARGYSVSERKTIINPDGSKRVENTEKEIAPDVTACIFWLKNRQKEDWRDVQKLEHSGTISWTDLMQTCKPKEK